MLWLTRSGEMEGNMTKATFFIRIVIPVLIGNLLASLLGKYLTDGMIDWKFAIVYTFTWSPIFSVILWINRKSLSS